MRALDADEVNRLLSAAAETDIGAMVTVAAYTGPRRSELLGLQRGDVNLDLAKAAGGPEPA